VRLAVAQTTVPEGPTDPGALRESGAQVRQLMRDAAAAGARLAQFPAGSGPRPAAAAPRCASDSREWPILANIWTLLARR
jgi:hypothetical protein